MRFGWWELTTSDVVPILVLAKFYGADLRLATCDSTYRPSTRDSHDATATTFQKTRVRYHDPLRCVLSEARAVERPNVMLIMADDLGYSDVGCYGGEIDTPNLDGLAAGGLQFTQFYNTGRCWPTRGALLTGYYAQQIRRDTLPEIPSGGRGVRPEWAMLLPMFLKPQGYRSYHTGKWHIDGMPLENGFDRSYYLRDQGRFFNPKVHWKDDNKLPPVEPNSGFYATTGASRSCH